MSLGLKLPGPGDLKLTGRGIKPFAEQVERVGSVRLPLDLIGSTRTRLADRGRVTIRLSAPFVPTGGSGESKSATIKLHG